MLKSYQSVAITCVWTLIAALVSCNPNSTNNRSSKDPSKPTDESGLPGYIVEVKAGEPAIVDGDGVRVIVPQGAIQVDAQVRLTKRSLADLPEEDRVVFASREAAFEVELVDLSTQKVIETKSLIKPVVIEREIPADWRRDDVSLAVIKLDADGYPASREKYASSEISFLDDSLNLTADSIVKVALGLMSPRFLFGFGNSIIEDDRFVATVSIVKGDALRNTVIRTANQANGSGSSSGNGAGDGDGGSEDTIAGILGEEQVGASTHNSLWGTSFSVDSVSSHPVVYPPVILNSGKAVITYQKENESNALYLRTYDIALGTLSASELQVYRDATGGGFTFFQPLVTGSDTVVLQYRTNMLEWKERKLTLSTQTLGTESTIPTGSDAFWGNPIIDLGNGEFLNIGLGDFGSPYLKARQFTPGGDYGASFSITHVVMEMNPAFHCAYSQSVGKLICGTWLRGASSQLKLTPCTKGTTWSCSDFAQLGSTAIRGAKIRITAGSKFLVAFNDENQTNSSIGDLKVYEFSLSTLQQLSSKAISQEMTPSMFDKPFEIVGRNNQIAMSCFNYGLELVTITRSEDGTWSQPLKVPGTNNPYSMNAIFSNLNPIGDGFIAWGTSEGGSDYSLHAINVVGGVPSTSKIDLTQNVVPVASGLSPNGKYGLFCFTSSNEHHCMEYSPAQ